MGLPSAGHGQRPGLGLPIQKPRGWESWEIESAGVSVTIPYWDMPPERIEGLKQAFVAIHSVMARFALVGYDPQLERESTSANFDELVVSVVSTRGKLVGSVEGKKPWWKFW